MVKMHSYPELGDVDAKAASMWKSYMKALRKRRGGGFDSEWCGIEEDITQHVRDYVEQSPDVASHQERVRQALASLGPVETIVADFNEYAPAALSDHRNIVLRRLASGAVLLVRGVMVSVALVFCVMGVSNLFNQDVGFWLHGRGDWSLSFERQAGATQVLRESFGIIAIMLAVSLAWIQLQLGRVSGRG